MAMTTALAQSTNGHRSLWIALTLICLPPLEMSALHASTVGTAGRVPFVQQVDTIVRMAGPPRFAGVAALVEDLSIGVLDGPEEFVFGDVFDITVDEDGSIYVLDRSVPAVRVFDEFGLYVRTFGRDGAGPGEIGNPSGMRVLRDGRFAIYDTGNRRVNVYSSSGDRITEWPIAAPGATVSHRFAFAADDAGFVYAKRSVIRTVSGGSAMDPSRAPFSYWLRLRTTDGAVVDSVAEPEWPPTPEPFRAENSRGWRQMAMPLRPGNLFVISPMGYAVSGVSNRYAFEILRPGEPVVSVRRDIPPSPVSRQERDAERSRIQTAMREVDPLWTWGGRDIPSVKPLYLDLAVGLDGRIWLTRDRSEPPVPPRAPSVAAGGGAAGRTSSATAMDTYTPGPTRFDVFEPDGTFVGAVEAPPGVALFVTRDVYAWAVGLDENDVEFVKRYRIMWP